MKTTTLDALFDRFLESRTDTTEELDLYHEVLQYTDTEYKDEAESALNCYAGTCQHEAFKQGFITAFRFLLDLYSSV